MSATALIVFREVLEAALVIGIVMAATRGIRGRNTWIGLGVAVGLAGAGLAAAFAGAIAGAAAGMGQELLNATILFLAVGMLGWHNVWMIRAGREIARDMAAVGDEVRASERPIYILAVVVGAAVLREGSEVVLFLYGIAAAQGSNANAMLTGGAIGLALGVAAGAAAYFGLVQFAGRYLFTVTGGLILLLAAGMAAQGAKFLSQAGYLPSLGQRIWDTSSLVSDRGPLGNLLHVLIGYSAQPDGIQLVFYLATLVTIGGFMYLLRHPESRARVITMVTVGVAAAGAAIATGDHVRAADYKVYSPIVEQGEVALEGRGSLAVDGDAAKDGAQSQRYELEYTPTEFWHTALVGALEKPAGAGLAYDATGWENIFQIFPQGQQWLDLGFYLEYERGHARTSPDALEWKILAEKSVGRLTFTVNPIFEKEVGPNATKSTEFRYAARVRWRLMRALEPAIEAYGDIGQIADVDPPRDQRHQIGPVILGKLRLGAMSAIRYELGYLFGLAGGASPDGTLKWLVEFEYHI